MTKILEVCAVDFTVKNLLLSLIDRLKEAGYEVEIACSEGEASKELEKHGYVFSYVKIERKISLVSNIKSIVKLYKIMKNGKYDIVHVHTPSAAILGRIAAKFARIPLVIYTAHGFYFHEKMSKFPYYLFVLIEKFLGRHFTDYIFIQSKEDYNNAIRLGIASERSILNIGNGVDINKFNPENVNIDIKEYKAKLNIPRDSIVLCFIGRLVREKGILDLLEAFKDLSFKYKELYLLIIGSTSPDERDEETNQKIHEFVNMYKLKNRVKLLGYRSDIPELLKISDIFILPSYREGMPRSIIEAMAMELPVIATNIRGSREEVENGETGILVPVGDVEALSNAITKLVEDQMLRKEMGKKGRELAEELFDEKKVLEKELFIINGLLNKGVM